MSLLRRDAPEQNIKDKQSICIIPDYTGKGAAGGRRRGRIARGEGGNQFKKVKPRRIGMEGRREEEGDANKSSLHARPYVTFA